VIIVSDASQTPPEPLATVPNVGTLLAVTVPLTLTSALSPVLLTITLKPAPELFRPTFKLKSPACPILPLAIHKLLSNEH